ncbi:MAG TPA: GNAT family N-acetyltransferase [Nitrospiraceae bacterium]|nr:GNAT family N-acetyltransferase [Nitrospiraceae bacterium]
MIRPYRESDAEVVALLFTDSVHDLASSDYDATQRAAWAPIPPDLNFWRERLDCLQTLVAELDQQLAGFISYERNGHIDLLYTSPAHSRRGIASALYRAAESDLARHGISEIFTEASIVARPFFERFGFHVVEEQCVQRRGVEFRRYAMRKKRREL